MNKKTPTSIALACVFVQTFVVFGDYTPGQLEPNWPVTLGPEEECEEVVAYLKDSVDSVARQLSGWHYYYDNVADSFAQVYDAATLDNPAYTNDSAYAHRVDYYLQVHQSNMFSLFENLRDADDITTNLLADVYQINCRDCVIGDPPEGPTNSNNCCDFTGLYARLDELIRLQTSIESNVQRLRTIDQNLQYSVFLLEHGFGTVTNQLSIVDTYLTDFGLAEPIDYSFWVGSDAIDWVWDGSTFSEPLENWRTPITALYSISYINSHLLASIASWQKPNYIITERVLRGISAPSPLLYFDAEVEERDYYTFLTNYYFAMVRGDEDIPATQRTNWFTRIETLLAALVFVDGSKSNLTEHVEDSVTNSINDVTESFGDFFEGVSGAPTSQIELVGDVERSMYQSLRQFSSAFSDATMPRSVRVIRVEKNVGAKSVSDVVDVSVEVEGRLLDMIEILRSATTLCWVFAGLFFMFKFSVWTVKKIYLLVRYAIDFFNMILGGK